MFEVEVGGPTTLRCADNSAKWLSVAPDNLGTAGKHLVQLLCDAKSIGPDSIAIGNVDITTGTAKNTIWVTAHTLTAAPSKLVTGPLSLSVGKDQHICFTEAFIIGKSRFLSHLNAGTMADRQAIILKEPSGWVLFQPWITPSPTLLNGYPLGLGGRALLQDGDTIHAGNLDLVACNQGPNIYSISKSALNLGTLGGPIPDSTFRIQCNNSSKEKVRLVANVPWIEVSPSEVELKKGESKDILVRLTAEAGKLPPAVYRERGAILTIGRTEIWSLDVVLDVQLATVLPEVAGPLKFGVVKDWTQAQASVMVSNKGRKDWNPTIRPSVNWLAFPGTNLHVPGGASIILLAKLNENVEGLPSLGAQSSTVTLEGDGVSLPITVLADLQLEVVKPVLVTPLADFGAVDDWEQATPKTIIIKNDGSTEWQATVRSKVPWIDVPDGPITVAAHGQRSLLVKINNQITPGDFDIVDGISVSGMGKTVSVRAKIALKPPTAVLEVFPAEVDLGRFDDWHPVQRRIDIRNRGNAEWIGEIRCLVPWLKLDPSIQKVRCAPKSSITLSLAVTEVIPPGKQENIHALALDGPGGPYMVQVRADYQPTPKLQLSTQALDFGKVSAADSSSVLKVIIRNDGLQVDTVTARTALPWLEVSPPKVTVPARSEAEIEFRLLPGANELPPGGVRERAGVTLAATSLTQDLEVMLTMSEYDLILDRTELLFNVTRSSDLTASIQTIKVSNNSLRPYHGHVRTRVKWLQSSRTELNIPAGGISDIGLRLTDDVWSLGTGSQFFGGVVAFENSTITLGARVQYKEGPPAEARASLEVDPNPLDFGTVNGGRAATSRQLRLRSGQDWKATLQTHDTWFEPVLAEVSGEGGKWATAQLRLTDQAFREPAGTYWGGLTVQWTGGSEEVPVKFQKGEPQVALSWDPPTLKMSCNPLVDAHLAVSVRVSNDSAVAADVLLQASASFLQVNPTTIHCSPNGSATFEVSLTPDAKSLSDGRYEAEVSLRSGSSYREHIPVSLDLKRVEPPKVVVEEPQFISFGDVDSDSWSEDKQQSISIRNPGPVPVTLTVTIHKANRWLEAPPELTIPAKSIRALQVNLKASAGKMALGRNEGTIELLGSGDPKQIHVWVNYVQAHARRIENAQPIDDDFFGYQHPRANNHSSNSRPLLPQLEVPSAPVLFEARPRAEWRLVAAQRVRVTNTGRGTWEGLIETRAEWLKASPASLKLTSGESQEIEVRLKPPSLLLTGTTSVPVYDEPNAIIIHNSRDSYAIHVCVGVQPSTSGQSPVAAKARPEISTNEPDTTKPPVPVGVERPISNKPPDAVAVAPMQLDFGKVSDWTEVEPLQINITNGTASQIAVEVQTARWLSALQGKRLTCPAHETLTFQVCLRRPGLVRPERGELIDSRGVTLRAGEQEFAISVHVETI
jgi:hypothetical protein